MVKRVVNRFLLGSGVIFLVVTATTLWSEYEDSLSRAQSIVESALDAVAVSLGRAMWSYDVKQSQAVCDSLLSISSVLKVEVLDKQHEMVASATKSTALPDIEKVFERTVKSGNQQQAIGSFRVYVSYKPIRNLFWRTAAWLALREFIKIAVLAVLLFYLLHRNIIVHLLDLVRQVEQLGPIDDAQPLVLQHKRCDDDEIDQLAKAINVFRRQIIDEQHARQRMELQSRSLGNELARIGRVATVQSLTSTIAHELNQPLGAILSNAEAIELLTLQHLSSGDSLLEMLADIVSEARRAGDIIRSLQNLMEKRDAEMSLLALSPLVRQVIDLVRMDTRWESIEIKMELADPLPSVMGNAVQLQQVILNLVANARDALRQAAIAEGLITVKARQSNARWIEVSISDNGPGVPSGDIDYIFKPFLTTKEGGTGMGLWIAQMIVEQHGGKLSLSNAPGGGAQFGFSLPIVVCS